MTTLYLFHDLIEAGSTANTVVSLFGDLWDGDAAADSVAPALMLLGVGT
jgi:hypothetical protein